MSGVYLVRWWGRADYKPFSDFALALLFTRIEGSIVALTQGLTPPIAPPPLSSPPMQPSQNLLMSLEPVQFFVASN